MSLLFALAGMLAPVQSAAPACTPDPPLAYVCGAEKPEDVLVLPGTPWLIASGFSPGAGLKLIDRRDRRLIRWFTGVPDQIRPDPALTRSCPGVLDPALFNARGLSLRQLDERNWRLLVVNHGGRESIEQFDIVVGEGSPSIIWRGCQPMPAGQVANSVASFADGTILATVLTRPGTSIADFVQGRVTGGVWQLGPGAETFTLLPGTELPGNNGLEVDPDQRRFYVIAFGWHAVVIYDRADTRLPLARVDAPDFMPDNIHWTDGRLLLAGMRLDEPVCGGLRRIANGIADPMRCHRGWVVGELDLAHHRVSTVAYGLPAPGFNGLSAAALVDGELWLGSFQSDRLAVVPLPHPKETP
ncbi:hypothetical protein [Sphingomonas sp. R1]|uniref:hypothetical protein n=1 Tax=Sphingomonas sp. R1 TaxID=399176 RepID=UPI0022249D84|nr:hypothetical protein [Sphingomonas sp. R1]UYY77829.1 hypothetical protein OIM94_02135 [Sphingomonas sp. R1]